MESQGGRGGVAEQNVENKHSVVVMWINATPRNKFSEGSLSAQRITRANTKEVRGANGKCAFCGGKRVRGSSHEGGRSLALPWVIRLGRGGSGDEDSSLGLSGPRALSSLKALSSSPSLDERDRETERGGLRA